MVQPVFFDPATGYAYATVIKVAYKIKILTIKGRFFFADKNMIKQA